MQYYQFHIGDYTTSTVHLSPLEDLAYRRLLDFYYMKEAPIPTDIPWVSHRLRLGSKEVENVLKEFFTLTEDGWENERCNADISSFHAHIEKQRENGKKGGRPRKKPKQNPKKPTANPPKSDGVPTVKPPSTHNPVPITHIKDIVDYLNSKTGSKYREDTPKTKDCISARFKDGFAPEDFIVVIDKKCREWLNTEQAKYLRPETLFGNKFEGYLNQLEYSGQSKGSPQQNLKNLPTQAEYEAQDDVTYDADGEPILPF